MPTQVERSEATIGDLVDAARQLFGDGGYAATSLDAIANAAGVTKGAVYHHFGSKDALFEAVFEREQERLARRLVQTTTRIKDPFERIRIGNRTFLEALLDPATAQIVMIDGPAVLGWERLRAIESRYANRLLERGLKDAAAAGALKPGDLDARARLLQGAMCDAGVFVARSQNPRRALKTVLSEVELLFDGFRV
jgi:AcrR family transcriptional regulator